MFVTFVAFVVLLLVLIFVHELGHFLAAKFLGVRVERFSLGFPPRIYSRKIGETVYQICWLPLGGYVKLLGEEPGTEISLEDQKVSFSHKPLWVKAVIVFAGPLFNLIFAFLALWILIMAVGFQHLPPVIGALPESSPAYVAGVRSGDVVKSLDDREIKYFDQISDYLDETDGKELAMGLERQGQNMSITVKPELKQTKDILGSSKSYWTLGIKPRSRPIIAQTFEGKPAQVAGIKPGDLVTAIDGKPINEWSELVEIVQGPEETRATETGTTVKPLNFEVERDGQILNFSVTPKFEASQNIEGKTLFTPMVGLSHKPELLVESVGLFRSLGYGFIESWNVVKLTYLTLYKLFQNKISPKVMGGPILIAEAAGSKIREGLAEFVSLMALISINLAILNLVPLPVLDGGQLLFFLIEAIRRKPLSLRFKEITQTVGVIALLALMVMVFYNDISRIVTRKAGPTATQVQTTE
ncbi:MAG: RIP metalloprotease RseP [Deltaproteobacteria bacterium]|jgi:regulator of sigma E protease|nr:RIP metalloprotease RseP [Deltaproteobacteria bacterium]